jgi:hypothetical protein
MESAGKVESSSRQFPSCWKLLASWSRLTKWAPVVIMAKSLLPDGGKRFFLTEVAIQLDRVLDI